MKNHYLYIAIAALAVWYLFLRDGASSGGTGTTARDAIAGAGGAETGDRQSIAVTAGGGNSDTVLDLAQTGALNENESTFIGYADVQVHYDGKDLHLPPSIVKSHNPTQMQALINWEKVKLVKNTAQHRAYLDSLPSGALLEQKTGVWLGQTKSTDPVLTQDQPVLYAS